MLQRKRAREECDSEHPWDFDTSMVYKLQNKHRDEKHDGHYKYRKLESNHSDEIHPDCGGCYNELIVPPDTYEPFSLQCNRFLKDLHKKLEEEHCNKNHKEDLCLCKICNAEFERRIPANVYQKMENEHKHHHQLNVLGCGGCYLHLSLQLNLFLKEFQLKQKEKHDIKKHVHSFSSCYCISGIEHFLPELYQKLEDEHHEGHDMFGCRLCYDSKIDNQNKGFLREGNAYYILLNIVSSVGFSRGYTIRRGSYKKCAHAHGG